MIIEHEDNPSWTVPAARNPGAQAKYSAPPRPAIAKPKRPSIATYLILGTVLVAMLAPALMGMG